MADTRSRETEAARFALLRRLAPSLRHRLMGDLQPVTLLAELAERQMAKPVPDLATARDTIGKARQQARAAVMSLTNVLAWITNEESPRVMAKEGLDVCVDLLRTDSEIRGVRVTRGEFAAADVIVSRRALRTVTTAAIIAAVDSRPAPAEVQVSCTKEPECVAVRIESRRAGQANSDVDSGDARPLTWADLDVIAADEDAAIERSLDPLVIVLRIPLAR